MPGALSLLAVEKRVMPLTLAPTMGGGIYLVQNGEQLVEMAEEARDSEDLLQMLLGRK
jgi:hypothetical protein